jgi:MFS family permease
MSQVAGAQSRPKRLFNFNFGLLLQGQTVSQTGNYFFYIAMVLWIKEATGSASLVGLLMMVSSLPGLILGPIGGTFSDRHSRKKIIIFTDAIHGLLIIALAALLYMTPNATEAILVALFATAALGAVLNAFFAPAITAAIPDLVPNDRIAGANAVMQAGLQVSMFIGQALGGVLYRFVGAAMIFFLNGVTFVFSAVSETFVSIPQKLPNRVRRNDRELDSPAAGADSGGDRPLLPVDPLSPDVGGLRTFTEATLDGLRYIWHRPGMRELVLGAALLGFFTVPVVVLMPFFVEDVLNVGPEWYGFVLAMFGAGTLLGSVAAGGIRVSGAKRTNLLGAVLVLNATAYLSLGLVGSVRSAAAIAVLAGCTGGFVTIIIATIVQATTASEMRGRAVSLVATLSGSLAPIAMGLSGVVADLTGQNIRAVYVFCGITMIILSLFLIANRNLRGLVAYDDATTSAAVQAGVQ